MATTGPRRLTRRTSLLATGFPINEAPAAEALQFMKDLIYKHQVAPEPSQEAGLGTVMNLMQTGKLTLQLTNPGANERSEGPRRRISAE